MRKSKPKLTKRECALFMAVWHMHCVKHGNQAVLIKERTVYFIEVVWNREFHWCSFGSSHETKERAESAAKSLLLSGDGSGVKKARVVDDKGNVVIPLVSC